MKVFGKPTIKMAALAVLGLSTIVGTGISAQAAPGANGGASGSANGGSANGGGANGGSANGGAHGGQGGGRGWGRGGRGGGRGMNLRGMAQKLNLSAAQQTQIKTILDGARAQSRAVWQNTSLTDAQKQERMKAIHKASRDAVMKVLTPAQQTQLRQMMAQKRVNADGDGRNRRNMAQELNLTDAQKEQMKSIRQRSRAALATVREDTSLSPQEKRAQLRTIRTQVQDSINAILTPEQQAKMQQIRQQRRFNRGNASTVARAARNRGLNG